MTFLALKQAVYRRVKLPDSPASADATRIGQFLNLRYRRLLASPGLDRCRDTTLTLTTVASQKKYGLAQAISRVRDLYDVTNQRKVTPQTVDWLRTMDPGLTATSATVESWIPLNGWGAAAQELTSTGVGLWVVSDAAGDTSQRAFVETVRLGGVRAGTSSGTLLTGTTRVAIGSSTDHIEVVKFYLDTVPTGTIALYDAASSGNVLAQITPGRTQARYFMIQLYPTPSAVLSLSVDCQRAIEDLVNDTEEPLFHEDFHDVLVHLACHDEWLNRDDEVRALRAYNPDERGPKGDANRILDDLRHSVLTNPDEIPVQRGPRGTTERASRLGGYYEANT